MTTHRQCSPFTRCRFARFACLGVLGLALACMVAGCSEQVRSLNVAGINTDREKIALDADDIVRVMQRAGFTEKQIIKHGPKLRNALARRGGARIRAGELTRAMFMVRDSEIYAVALNRGAFRYNPDKAPDSLAPRFRESDAGDEQAGNDPS